MKTPYRGHATGVYLLQFHAHVGLGFPSTGDAPCRADAVPEARVVLAVHQSADEVRSGQVRPGQGRPGQGRAGQARAGQGRAEQGRAG